MAGMRRSIAATAALLLAASTGALAAPMAQAKDLPGPQETYLFVVDGTNVKVIPGKGHAAKLVIENPDAIRFSDRPYRHQLDMSVREMLGEFEWSAKTHKLAPATPNASVSVGGTSQIVDIRKAVIHDNRLVLSVRGIAGAVRAAEGPGTVFIDNTVTFPLETDVPIPQIEGVKLRIHVFSPERLTVEVWVNLGVVAVVQLTADDTTGTYMWSTGDAYQWWNTTFNATFTDSTVDVRVDLKFWDNYPDPLNRGPLVATAHFDL